MVVNGQEFVYDVAVVGAGPAGSATARRLALQGWRVALLERTGFEGPRIGESLTPNIQVSLEELGVWSKFLKLASMPSWGTASLWGNAEPQTHSHLTNPYGCGWHVNRQAFDQLLADEAAAAGARLINGWSLRHCTYLSDRWQLLASANDAVAARDQLLYARVLIDATGRRAQIARSLGASRLLFDHLVGVAARFVHGDPKQAGFLLVETAPEGWWYSAPLPPGVKAEGHAMIAMLMTDADLCSQSRLSNPALWHATLSATKATNQRLKSGEAISSPQVFCAYSQRLRHDHGKKREPCLAVGDAALAVDPISGSGVIRALTTARAAADTVSEMLKHPHSSQEAQMAYETELDRACTLYLLERAQYYSVERRFHTPFWQRRQVL